MRRTRWPLALALGTAALLPHGDASAFCGFYVSGADAKLFNNATQVVLLRHEARTVLSMQNEYQGPPEDFAMVVPVPIVLQKENVKTLSKDVFARLDRLTAPRLVEYHEQDPCAHDDRGGGYRARSEAKADMAVMPMAPAPAAQLVKIEAEFTVGEYEIVILSALDSMALDTWLRQNSYKIPEGAETVLRPYVQQGSKFFVARVNSSKVRFEGGRAVLSPLRFHYDDDAFKLPVRLGLLNSQGKQDLIIHVIAKQQRYEVANYPNVTIPTNIELREGAEGDFGQLYMALFDRTVERHPGAVVTEYAWAAGSCDPCPGPALTEADLMTLGADSLLPADANPITPPNPPPGPPASSSAKPPAPPRPGASASPTAASPTPPSMGRAPMPPRPPHQRAPFAVWEATVTRLHARYAKETLGEDLVFKKAQPITGGNGTAEHQSQDAQIGSYGQSMFQGRYIIRHPWQGEIGCADPRYGLWGGSTGAKAAQNTQGERKTGLTPESWLAGDVPSVGWKGARVVPERKLASPVKRLFKANVLAWAVGVAVGLLAVLWVRRAAGREVQS